MLVVVDQPATIGALAVAAQDMGITVGHPPGLPMRRIAGLTPGSAKTDAKDAAVAQGAASRTMPHTLRAVSTSDEDAAALSMLTELRPGPGPPGQPDRGPDPGPVVHPDPAQPSRPWRGPGWAHDSVLRLVAARHRPSRPETSGQDKDRRQAQEARVQTPHTTRAAQIVSALERQECHRRRHRDAAAVVLPHLARQLIALHAQRADAAARVEALAGPALMCQVPPPAPGIRIPAAAVLAGRDPGQDLQSPEPTWPPTPGSLPITRRCGSSIRGEHVSHGGNKDSSAPCPPPPSPPRAPTPSPRPTTSANATTANARRRPRFRHTAASRPFTPRSATAPSTPHNQPPKLPTAA